jgi:hypothetical protein
VHKTYRSPKAGSPKKKFEFFGFKIK